MAKAYNRVLVLHVFKLPHLNLERHLGLRDTMGDDDDDEDDEDDEDEFEDEDEGKREEESDFVAQAATITPADYEPYIFHDLNFGEDEHGKEEKAAAQQESKESKGDAPPGNENVEKASL